ncbi:MAG TPA: PVC-type heme-binding CxxCH protein [Vicinamibacterales bacterium]
MTSSLRLAIVAPLALAASLRAPQNGPPYSPQAALGTFRLADGFQIELFAAEPLVSDPVAMEVDEHGRIYVVEMPGYPLDVSGSGRVVLLQDTDGDGKPDTRVVFADGLRLPNGIMRWKKGVIVTDAPDVLYLEDTDGDGRADVKRVLLTGFARTNPQHMMNSPVYGLDNWIYLANESPVRTIRYQNLFGDVGSEIEFPDRSQGPRLPVDAGGRNVRFRPDTFDAEMLSSHGQFGHTFDAMGHHFLNTNNRHIYQEVIAQRYVARNPAFAAPSVVQQLPDYQQPADVFPITKDPEFQLLTDIGVMTSASGLTYYLADLFPPAYRNTAFIAESAHNLVHADTVREQGSTFRASRMFDGHEFLASTDAWFRPVNFYIGPDGALYVIDYYREIIEHPEWLDDETAKSPKLYAGRGRGRIYRIVPTGTRAPTWANHVGLGDASSGELVAALANPNIWWRRQAQRVLVDRHSRDVIAPLARLAAADDSPVGRVHAMWTLEGLHALDTATIERAFNDRNPGVRENAIQLAELHLQGNARLAAHLLSMRADPHPRVRFQLLLTLGDLETPEAAAVRNQLLFDGVEDQWMQDAALSARNWDPVQMWDSAVDKLVARESAGRRALFARIAAAAAGKPPRALRDILNAAVGATASPRDSWWRASTIEGLASGVRARKRPGPELDPERTLVASRLFGNEDAAIRSAELQLLAAVGLPPAKTIEPVLQKAEQLVADRRADAEVRADAVRLLALGDVRPHETLLRGVLARAEPTPVQVAAVRALGTLGGSGIAATFIELWDGWTPAVRDEAVRALVREPGRIRALLDAVAAGRIRMTEIDRSLRIRLMMVDDESQRARARALFSEAGPGSVAAGTPHESRADVIARYQPAVALAGDPQRGRDVFARICFTCHQYRGAIGSAFGPDLGEVRNHLPQALLVDILDPNNSIADGFALWSVELSDGTTVGGIISEETSESVTLRLPGGSQTTVPRARIKAMHASNVSAMPEGLESQIDVQQMADLIAFIRGKT